MFFSAQPEVIVDKNFGTWITSGFVGKIVLFGVFVTKLSLLFSSASLGVFIYKLDGIFFLFRFSHGIIVIAQR